MREEEAPQIIGPHSLEAEQALLGAILFDNTAYDRLTVRLQPDDFAEPFHGRLWQVIEQTIQRGRGVMAELLATRFADDPACQELGGIRYLADLMDHAPPGATAPTYAEAIKESATRRSLVRVAGDLIDRANRDHDTCAADQIVETEAELYKLAETGSVTSVGFCGFEDVLRGAVEMAEAAHARDGKLVGVSTGLMDLDYKLGGLHPSDLLILAGRPSMGKTALATNIAFSAADKGYKVGFFSLEMSGEQLALRILADRAGIPGDRIRKGETTPVEIARVRDAAEEIGRLPLYTDATGGIGIAQLTARARRLKRKLAGLDLLIIDYLQLVTTKARPGANRVGEVTEITGGLKALAKELNIPVLALSQLSRAVEQREDKRPQLSDLRESGSIEQDADVVMFVYREAYYVGRTQPRLGSPEHVAWEEEMDKVQGKAEVIIGKQRHGPIGTVHLAFNDETTRFSNLAREGSFDQAKAGPLPARFSYGYAAE